jgi:uncharacterized coiled-coil DUF342 family protein
MKKEFDMDRFAELVVGEFQNIHQEFQNIHQEFRNVHDEFENIRTEFQNVHQEFQTVHRDIGELRSEMHDMRNSQDRMEAQLENHSGFAKEIDHVLDRVVRIEKHVCIDEA